MKQIQMALLASAVMLFTACGGGGGSSDVNDEVSSDKILQFIPTENKESIASKGIVSASQKSIITQNILTKSIAIERQENITDSSSSNVVALDEENQEEDFSNMEILSFQTYPNGTWVEVGETHIDAETNVTRYSTAQYFVDKNGSYNFIDVHQTEGYNSNPIAHQTDNGLLVFLNCEVFDTNTMEVLDYSFEGSSEYSCSVVSGNFIASIGLDGTLIYAIDGSTYNQFDQVPPPVALTETTVLLDNAFLNESETAFTEDVIFDVSTNTYSVDTNPDNQILGAYISDVSLGEIYITSDRRFKIMNSFADIEFTGSLELALTYCTPQDPSSTISISEKFIAYNNCTPGCDMENEPKNMYVLDRETLTEEIVLEGYDLTSVNVSNEGIVFFNSTNHGSGKYNILTKELELLDGIVDIQPVNIY